MNKFTFFRYTVENTLTKNRKRIEWYCLSIPGFPFGLMKGFEFNKTILLITVNKTLLSFKVLYLGLLHLTFAGTADSKRNMLNTYTEPIGILHNTFDGDARNDS